MAVDTHEKRASAFALLVPSYAPGINPSSVDQAERQASAWTYSGIAAGGAVAPSGPPKHRGLTVNVGRLLRAS